MMTIEELNETATIIKRAADSFNSIVEDARKAGVTIRHVLLNETIHVYCSLDLPLTQDAAD